jgi:hypothetical protein
MVIASFDQVVPAVRRDIFCNDDYRFSVPDHPLNL